MRGLLLLILSLGTLLLTTGLSQAQQNDLPPNTYEVNTVDQAYTLLADDSAGSHAWVAAARKIISYQRDSFELYKRGPKLEIEDFPIPDHYVPLGESLRIKTSPSVSDLLLKRISFVYLLDHESPSDFNIPDTTHLVQDLALWDGKAHLEDLQKYSLFLAKRSSISQDGLVELYQKRIQLGDSQVMGEYLSGLFPPDSSTVPRTIFHNTEDFSLLYTNLDVPALSHFSEQVLATPNSPLFPILQLDRNYQNDGLLSTPLFRLAPFRAEVIRELKDTTLIENCTLKDVSGVLTSRLHVTLAYSPYRPSTSDATSANLGFDLRFCDVVASYISRLKGAPDFAFDGPELDRNAAIQRQITFINQYGNSFEYRQEGNAVGELGFPQLNHPATPDDVAAGKAIFSLTKYNLPTRVIPLESAPLFGLLKPSVTDDSAAHIANIANPSDITNFTTPVQVWQAEAVFTNGAWHRFFGIVSNHSVRMAPEADIKTGLPPEWFINATLQCFLQGSSTFSHDSGIPVVPQIQIPVPLRIVLLNYAPQPVPVPFIIGANPRTLPVSISMFYRPLPSPSSVYQPPPNAWRFRPNPMGGGVIPSFMPYPQGQETALKSLQLLPLPPTSPSATAPPSTPTGSTIPSYGTVILTQFDLGTLYDITLPGSYEFRIGDPQQETNYVTYKFMMKE